MIATFKAENFRSIKDEIKLSFEASTAIKDMERSGYTSTAGWRVLNATAFFGANSSGKSNVFNAVGLMRAMIIQSVKLNDNERLPYDPFLLSDDDMRPTSFEMEFDIEGDKYRYAFSYTAEKIVEERLEVKMPRRSSKIFLMRRGDVIETDEANYKDGNAIKNGSVKLNANRLFLSLAAQTGGEMSKKVIEWFRTHLNVISGLSDNNYSMFTKEAIHRNSPYKSDILRFIGAMEVGFSEVTTKQEEFDERAFPKGLPADLIAALKEHPMINAYARHTKVNAQGQAVGFIDFDIDERESDGTIKLFNLAGPIIDTLQKGKVLFIDELDARLHPLMAQKIVEMFNNSNMNSHGAQLVFTTHDTNLLSRKLLRRDQVVFVEKDYTTYATRVTPMLDISMKNGTKPRTDSNYEKNYLEGNYGAIPNIKLAIEDFEHFIAGGGEDEQK